MSNLFLNFIGNQEAIENAQSMQKLLQDDAAARMQVYINKMIALRDGVAGNLSGNFGSANPASVEQLKRNFMRDFSYRKIKNSLRAP